MSRSNNKSGIFWALAFVSCASDNNAMHFGVVWLFCEIFEAFFYIDSPEAQNDNSMFRVTVGFYIIIIKPFNSLVVDIFKSLHAFFFKDLWGYFLEFYVI